MTLSVPSFSAAATSLLIPPPADADVTVAQLVLPLDVDGELVEQPAAAKASAAAPTREKPEGYPTGNCLLYWLSHFWAGSRQLSVHHAVVLRRSADPPATAPGKRP